MKKREKEVKASSLHAEGSEKSCDFFDTTNIIRDSRKYRQERNGLQEEVVKNLECRVKNSQ